MGIAFTGSANFVSDLCMGGLLLRTAAPVPFHTLTISMGDLRTTVPTVSLIG